MVVSNESFARHGINPFYAVKCDDARTAITWAIAGLGVALVPGRIAQNLAKQPQSPIKYRAWQSKIELVWPKDQFVRPVVEHSIELFR
ncbi:LysR family transcriptional regulator substrate-binding protein [Limosilactobacillus caecicola]|uniref:LysR family transcriptional regulator substrate-binding protein n=1 Tax=Limosilactobacillus caecicola TaxID=2941332 RepID=UPI0038991689